MLGSASLLFNSGRETQRNVRVCVWCLQCGCLRAHVRSCSVGGCKRSRAIVSMSDLCELAFLYVRRAAL